jgi:hypothetical protein
MKSSMMPGIIASISHAEHLGLWHLGMRVEEQVPWRPPSILYAIGRARYMEVFVN